MSARHAVLMRKVLGGLTPAAADAEEALRNCRDREEVLVEIKRARNPRAHRLFWALCNIIHKNTERYRSVEDVGTMFKIATGHCETHVKKPNRADAKAAADLRALAERLHNSAPKWSTRLGEVADHLMLGQEVYVPKSISFASMGEDEFREFLDRCIKLTVEHILPAVDEADVRREMEAMIGG